MKDDLHTSDDESEETPDGEKNFDATSSSDESSGSAVTDASSPHEGNSDSDVSRDVKPEAGSPDGESDLSTEAQHKNTKPTVSTMIELDKKGTFLGIDLGTNTTVVLGTIGNGKEFNLDFSIPTVIGETPSDSIMGFLEPADDVVVGQKALDDADYLNLRYPLRDGVINDPDAVRIFFESISRRIAVENPNLPSYAVIGIPAKTTSEDREAVARSVAGIFENFILAPEPFLAALGYREGSKGADENRDVVQNSLIIDIGAGTTDVCVVQGRFPSEKETRSIPFAGDWIDNRLYESLAESYPSFDLDIEDVRAMKEEHASTQKNLSAVVETILKGRRRTLDISETLSDALTELVDRIVECCIEVIESSPSRMSGELVKNIFVTGGGSQIRYLDSTIQDRLAKYGFESPSCRSVGAGYAKLVAHGAWRYSVAAPRKFWKESF